MTKNNEFPPAPAEVVLYHPQIPHNTGAIARSCAAVQTPLHVIEPLGFSMENRWVRRAGLDYWPAVDLTVWPDLESLRASRPHARCWWITKYGKVRYDRAEYGPGDLLVFGSEIDGLPQEILDGDPDHTVYIPMTCDAVRSLNLANVATLLLFESRRRLGILEPSP